MPPPPGAAEPSGRRYAIRALRRVPPMLVHATYVHGSRDVRIFHKECRTLAAAGHDVHLIVPAADDVTDGATEGGVTFHAVPRATAGTPWGRLREWQTRFSAVIDRLGPRAVHVHDPLLVPVALAARERGAAAIYDAHEEHALHAWRMRHLPWWRRAMLARAYGRAERAARDHADLVVAATPQIAVHFPPLRTVTVRNLPILGEFEAIPPCPADGAATFAYIGGLTDSRGVPQMIDAVAALDPDVRLALAGVIDVAASQRAWEARPGWAHVDALGWLDRAGIVDLLAKCRAGLVVLQPSPDFETSWPVKMFEYMAAGRAVVASHFPLWREIIDDAQCGMIVDPTDVSAIAGALQELVNDPDRARTLGANGRRAIAERYAWHHDAERLLEAYARVLGD